MFSCSCLFKSCSFYFAILIVSPVFVTYEIHFEDHEMKHILATLYTQQFSVFFINENFDVFGVVLFEGLVDLGLGVFVSQLAPHERARAALLHELALAVARQLGEALVAIHDRVVDDLRVGQQERIVYH